MNKGCGRLAERAEVSRKRLSHASWDAEIYSRLPSMVLRTQLELRGSVYVDVTTTRNTDGSFVLLNAATGPMQGRIGDLAMTINPPYSLSEGSYG